MIEKVVLDVQRAPTRPKLSSTNKLRGRSSQSGLLLKFENKSEVPNNFEKRSAGKVQAPLGDILPFIISAACPGLSLLAAGDLHWHPINKLHNTTSDVDSCPERMCESHEL